MKLQRLITLLVFVSISSSCQNYIRSTNYTYSKPLSLTDSIKTAGLEAAGIDSTQIIKLTKLILADSFPNIHSLLIYRNDKLVYENYFSGKDNDWGSNLGYIQHGIDDLHDVRSISKSVVAACIDIAIQQKKIKSIDDPIFDYLPNYLKFKTPQNEKISIRDFLTMSSGMQWNEKASHGTTANNESEMEKCIDPVEYVLRQPMDTVYGRTWNYNSGGVQILAEIIKNVSGNTVDQYASEYLFAPSGIKKFKWTKTTMALFQKPANYFKLLGRHRTFPAAASGLRLTSRDLLKFGLLYLNNGKWNDQQILTENWVSETFKKQINRESEPTKKAYSFLFWIDADTIKNKSYEILTAKGNGDQRIFLNKELQLAVVITAGNYDKWDIENDSHKALVEYIMPAIRL
jgi:CubicO group peptidase (beta-lactamase class C family)